MLAYVVVSCDQISGLCQFTYLVLAAAGFLAGALAAAGLLAGGVCLGGGALDEDARGTLPVLDAIVGIEKRERGDGDK